MESERSARIVAIDVVRGVIVALMALDHTRIFFAEAAFDPLDLAQTTPAYFLTRWITHLCAPGFFFLAGISVWLQEQRGVAHVSRWAAARGLWLILLEVTVISFAWSFTLEWRFLGVMWGLGISMVLLAILRKVRRTWLLGACALFLLLHDAVALTIFEMLGLAPTLIYSAGVFDAPLQGSMLVIYPILPWVTLMVLGYATAHWVVPQVQAASDRLLWGSVLAVLFFVVARVVGWGGGESAPDPLPAGMRVLSFLNVEKYPPSLQFALLTLGILGILGWWIARRVLSVTPRTWAPLHTFGQEPFFFYAIHLFLIHGAAWAFARGLGWPIDFVFWRGIGPNLSPPPGYGTGLPGVYLIWVVVLVVAWGACLGFHRLRTGRKGWIWRLV